MAVSTAPELYRPVATQHVELIEVQAVQRCIGQTPVVQAPSSLSLVGRDAGGGFARSAVGYRHCRRDGLAFPAMFGRLLGERVLKRF